MKLPVRVLFVCLGNICRSPTAQGVFQTLVASQKPNQAIEADSAGTSNWHPNKAPDKRAQAAARKRGIELSGLKARQVIAADFQHFDYIIAMDHANLHDLRAQAPTDSTAQIELLLNYAKNTQTDEVPDPYYGGEEGFDQALDLIEEAAAGLLEHITQKH